jgi:UDP-sugar transporter A1/2/3
LLVFIANGASVAENGFFYGYNIWTWTTIFCQALGGLIVAVVVKYADNILKGFATSLSIILSCIASVFLFEFVVSGAFVIGASIVLYATHLYGAADAPAAARSSRSTFRFAERGDKPLLPSSSQDDLDLRK